MGSIPFPRGTDNRELSTGSVQVEAAMTLDTVMGVQEVMVIVMTITMDMATVMTVMMGMDIVTLIRHYIVLLEDLWLPQEIYQ